MRDNKRATISDVATQAGVSRAAVSKVMRSAYGTSDDMRKRVEGAMAALNYRPQFAARALRGRTYTLGVLLPDIRNPFFPDILDGITQALADTQYQPLLGVRPSVEVTERGLIETMLDRKLDGLILVAPVLGHDYLMQLSAMTPTVLIGRHDQNGGFDTVNNDDRLGAKLAIDHLVAQGHSHIAYLDLEPLKDAPFNPARFRRQGYQSAMRAHGLGENELITVIGPDSGSERGRAAARQLLTSKRRPTAVFGWTDESALTVMSAAHELGLRIPEDLALAGYDNSRLCALAQISLTSIDQDAQLLGRASARMLIERIEGRREDVHFVTAPQIVVRGSSGGARANGGTVTTERRPRSA